MSRPTLEVQTVSKRFGATLALDQVSFDLRPGEVHAIAGENGAGKSTLIGILSGAHTEYEGACILDGKRVRFRGPRDAFQAKIATIFQELSLVGSLSIADNFLLVDKAPMLGRVARSRALERTRGILRDLSIDAKPEQLVETLPLSVRQLVEIGRALAMEAKVLIMDEPTSALGDSEAERLLQRIERLKQSGNSIIYISHRLPEIFRLADRITVLRDGRRVLTAERGDLNPDSLVREMVGRSVTAVDRGRTAFQEDVLRVRNLGIRDVTTHRPVLSEVDLSLARGEVVGLAGLQGSGASAILHALYSSQLGERTGTFTLEGRAYTATTPRAALRAGVMLLPNDRARSVFRELSVTQNVTLSLLARSNRKPNEAGEHAPISFGWLQKARETLLARSLADRVKLRGPGIAALAGMLSGGNQQKVALMRAIATKPKLLLLDEPTRGVDVAAKADIHALIRELGQQGTSVLVHSSEPEELVTIADRVMVLSRGRAVDTLVGAGITTENILRLAMGAA